MKSKSIKGSTFCLFMLLMNICIWLVLYFFLSKKDVAVFGCYQGRLDEVLEMVSQSETGVRQSIISVKYYQNDDAKPQKDDIVTAIEFVGDDVLFYKGEIHEQTLIDERVLLNRKMTNVFMGIYCAIFAALYLISRAEEKRAQKAFVSDN